MKKLLSILSGHPMLLLFSLLLVASFLIPAQAIARYDLSCGGGTIGSYEGDPLDTNDFGSSGGDTETEVQNQTSDRTDLGSLVFELDRVQILLVPEFVGGKLIFRIMVIEKVTLGMGDGSVEGSHAP